MGRGIQAVSVLLVAALLACSTPPEGIPPPSSRGLVDPVTDQVIHVSALVAVPPGRAFEYFTRAELLETWLTAAAEVEPRVGGKYELF